MLKEERSTVLILVYILFFFNGNNFKFWKLSAVAAQSFLKREWLDAEGQREKGAKHNENLQFLLK